MARIDLIPPSWRERRRVRRVMRAFALGLFFVLGLTLAARLFVAGKMIEANLRETRLAAEKKEMDSAMAANRAAYERLKKLRGKTERLERNRSVSLAETILSPLDQDLSAAVKLESLIATVDYRGDGKSGPAHLALFGVASDATQMSEFADRLTKRPTWSNLKVGRVAPAREGAGIEFGLEIDIAAAPPPGAKP